MRALSIGNESREGIPQKSGKDICQDEGAAVSVNIRPRLKSPEMENVSDRKRHSKKHVVHQCRGQKTARSLIRISHQQTDGGRDHDCEHCRAQWHVKRIDDVKASPKEGCDHRSYVKFVSG